MTDAQRYHMPIGYFVPFWEIGTNTVTKKVMTDNGWVTAEGSFTIEQYPKLAELFRVERPRFEWLHPLKSRRKQRLWDEGEQFAYGGTEDSINFPNFRGMVL